MFVTISYVVTDIVTSLHIALVVLVAGRFEFLSVQVIR